MYKVTKTKWVSYTSSVPNYEYRVRYIFGFQSDSVVEFRYTASKKRPQCMALNSRHSYKELERRIREYRYRCPEFRSLKGIASPLAHGHGKTKNQHKSTGRSGGTIVSIGWWQWYLQSPENKVETDGQVRLLTDSSDSSADCDNREQEYVVSPSKR